VLANRVVPNHLPVIGEDGQERGGERLRARRQGKDRVGRDRRFIPQHSPAIALEDERILAANDYDRRAGHVPGRQCPGREAIDRPGVGFHH
jgi:hypothetical protein